MINLTVRTDGTNEIRERMDLLSHPDLKPLLDKIAERIEIGTRRDREAGVGANGTFDPIKESTQKRRSRAGRGTGPPLFPDDSSRMANITVEVLQETPEHGLVVGGWPGTEAFLNFHIDGDDPRMPMRNPIHVSDQTWEEIRSDITDFYVMLLVGERP
jgi:hypothetical protein